MASSQTCSRPCCLKQCNARMTLATGYSASGHESRKLIGTSVTCEESHARGAQDDLIPVPVGTGSHHAQVVIHKALGVLLGSAEVNQAQRVCRQQHGTPRNGRPVGMGEVADPVQHAGAAMC